MLWVHDMPKPVEKVKLYWINPFKMFSGQGIVKIHHESVSYWYHMGYHMVYQQWQSKICSIPIHSAEKSSDLHILDMIIEGNFRNSSF